ncbi:uncharacterized protein [Spinacia oleracea]|uniref:Retrotransposon gag domain-containing protein n=1 Tax=Spinacia oleracea TaxID=3562 RepID=A0ABM3QQ67_SPIOL|nr:uncharacterized protein LOC130461409 [Spinacia oleracea]
MDAYKAQMTVQTGDEAAWCRFFPATLKGMALSLFSGLSAGVITRFSVLEALFKSQFIAGQVYKKTNMHLMSVQQQPNESLKEYIKRFNDESLNIPNLQDSVAFTALMTGLKEGSRFRWVLAGEQISTLPQEIVRAHRYIQSAEICNPSVKTDLKRKKDVVGREKEKKPRETENGNDTRYNSNRREIYLDIKEKSVLPNPTPIRTPASKRDKSLWCEFPKECGHTTKDCRELKRALDRLADEGKLNKYLKGSSSGKKEDNKGSDVHSDHTEGYVGVLNVEAPPSDLKCPTITFQEDPSQTVHAPHDDPLVIEIKVANRIVKRVLIDSGSSADILTLEYLERLRYKKSDLIDISQPHVGFSGQSVYPVGMIKLPVRIGEKGKGEASTEQDHQI